MDVRCPQCDTLYEVDAAQMRGDSATLKCSQCSHLFRMQSDEAVVQENHRRWMVRSTSSGDVRYFSSFAQLHEWILAGQVDKSDQISRTGKSWTQLTDIGEFMPILQAVDSITSISATHAAATRDGRANSAQSGPGLSQSSPAQSNPAQSSPAQSSPAQSSPAQSSPPQSSPNKPAGAEAVQSTPAQPESASVQPEPSRRPADTSKQFGASETGPRRTTGSHTAGSQAAGSQAAGSQAAATQPDTGLPANTGSPASADQSELPPSPSDESPSPRKPPQVRLQTGAFGAAGPAEDRPGRQNTAGEGAGGSTTGGPSADDQWSFGDAALGEVEDSGRYRGEPAAPSSASRWPLAAVVCVVVLAAAAATIYRVRPELLDGLVGDQAGTSVVELSRDAPAAPSTSPGPRISAALVAAERAAQRANDAAFVELADTASSRVWAGVEQAQISAKKAGQTPDVATLLAQGNHLIEDGRPRRARSKFRAVLDADSDNVAAMTGLGWSLLAMGRSSAASARFRRALRRRSSSGDAYIGLAKAQRNLGNNRAALDAYQTYLAEFPDGAKASIARYQTKQLEQVAGP